MFLLSGEYFDHVDDDLRGNLHLVKEADFKKQNESNLFAEEELLVDNIVSQTNGKISEIYPVFSAKREETLRNLDELQSMFLIDEKSIESFRKKVKFSDSDAQILSMIYKTEMEDIEEIRDSDPYFQEAPNLGYIYINRTYLYQLSLVGKMALFILRL